MIENMIKTTTTSISSLNINVILWTRLCVYKNIPSLMRSVPLSKDQVSLLTGSLLKQDNSMTSTWRDLSMVDT